MTQHQKILALLTRVVALVLEIVDHTIVSTALPAIKAAYRADLQASQRIVAGYAPSFALLFEPLERVMDLALFGVIGGQPLTGR